MAPDTIFPFTGLHKELDVRFALYYDRQDFVDTLRALDDGTLAVDGLVTDVVDLDALPDTFATLLRRRGARARWSSPLRPRAAAPGHRVSGQYP